MFGHEAVEEEIDQIGEKLREAREAAGLTIDDVVYQAHLPRSVVEALEAEDFSVFTSPTYAKSFLSQYSAFVGVDADPWLDALLPAHFVGGETYIPLIDSRFIPFETAPARDTKSFLPALWLLLISGGLIFAGIKGYQFLEAKLAEQEESVQKEVPTAPPAPEMAETPPPPASELVAGPPEPEAAEEETVQAPPRAIIVRD